MQMFPCIQVVASLSYHNLSSLPSTNAVGLVFCQHGAHTKLKPQHLSPTPTYSPILTLISPSFYVIPTILLQLGAFCSTH